MFVMLRAIWPSINNIRKYFPSTWALYLILNCSEYHVRLVRNRDQGGKSRTFPQTPLDSSPPTLVHVLLFVLASVAPCYLVPDPQSVRCLHTSIRIGLT